MQLGMVMQSIALCPAALLITFQSLSNQHKELWHANPCQITSRA